MSREPRDIFHVRFLEVPDVVKLPKRINVDFRLGVLYGIGIGMMISMLISMLALLARNI